MERSRNHTPMDSYTERHQDISGVFEKRFRPEDGLQGNLDLVFLDALSLETGVLTMATMASAILDVLRKDPRWLSTYVIANSIGRRGGYS